MLRKKNIFLLIFLFPIFFEVKAQIVNGHYATSQDSIECLQLISKYKNLIIHKEYELAINPWRTTFFKCPGSNLSLYVDGVKILKNRIDIEKSKLIRQRYIDTLIFVYDQRIRYFGHDPIFSTSYIFGLMGLDLQQFRPEAFDEAYHYLSQCFVSQQKQTIPSVLVGLMKSAVAMAKAKMLPLDSVTFYYKNSIEITNSLLKTTVSSDKRDVIMTCVAQIEDFYLSSGVKDCSALEETLEPRFNAAPYDPIVVKRIATLLDKSNCHGSALFRKISEKLYSMDTTSSNAALMARQFVNNNDADGALSYYKKALSMEKDSMAKSRILLEIGSNLFLKFNRYSEAKIYLMEAKSCSPRWAEPIFYIGKLYAEAARSYSKITFENRTLYWAAVDKFQEAIKLDPSIKITAELEISNYSARFPSMMDIYGNGFAVGEKMTIKGWVSEITEVRARKD